MSSTTAGLSSARDLSSSSSVSKTELYSMFQKLKDSFDSGMTFDVKWRISQLSQLEAAIVENCDQILDAVRLDLGRPTVEGLMGDVITILDNLRYSRKNLKHWTAPERVPHPIQLQPGHSVVLKQPKGVALIIGAWNFPFHVTLIPLVDAIAAGCCCLIKPSEVSSNSANLMASLIKKYLNQDCYKVVLGGVPETTDLLSFPFHHIFYTGNGAIAKVVMRAASEHLASVTLELGGKSPVFVEKDADIAVAAKRIIIGKVMNCGQICLAPDYVLCHKDVEKELVQAMLAALTNMFGKDVESSNSYGRIINTRHWDRIANLIQTSKGDIIVGGISSAKREEKFIPPTIIMNPDPSSPIAKEEIFGPVLPIFTVTDTNAAIDFIKQHETPLALYVFSKNQKTIDTIISKINSGGVCINDCLMHNTNPSLPFGGHGPSGMGKYHGKAGFDEFSHTRAIMNRPTFIDPAIRYPPYSDSTAQLMRRIFVLPLVGKSVWKTLKTLRFFSILIILILIIRRKLIR